MLNWLKQLATTYVDVEVGEVEHHQKYYVSTAYVSIIHKPRFSKPKSYSAKVEVITTKYGNNIFPLLFSANWDAVPGYKLLTDKRVIDSITEAVKKVAATQPQEKNALLNAKKV